jgi:predicted nucleotidyltransferase
VRPLSVGTAATDSMAPVRELAEQLMEIPGVLAVTLGGSRAGGVIHPDSDWDFGLYYHDAIRADEARRAVDDPLTARWQDRRSFVR